MKLPKTLLVVCYLFLFFWWVLINLHGLRESLGNLYFSLGMSFYSLVLGLYICHTIVTSQVITKSKSSAISMCLGMVFYGLGAFTWFCLDFIGSIMLFPSIAAIFYGIQFPFFIIGLLLIFESNLVRGISKGLFVTIVTLFLVIFYSNPISAGYFDYAKFLIFFFPIETLVLCLLALLTFVKVSKQQQTLSWLIFTLLGFLTWFAGDVFFFYEILNGKFFSASYVDFLYLTGVFFAFVGITNWISDGNSTLSLSDDGFTLFRKITYRIPTSLNVRA